MAKRRKKKSQHTLSGNSLPLKNEISFSLLGFALLTAVIALLVYLPSLDSDFVYDARKEIIEEGFITSLSNLSAVLSLKVLGMNLMLSDRPGQLLYLMIIAAFSGRDPFGYHLCSVILHAVNAGLLFYMLQHLARLEVTSDLTNRETKIRLAAAVATLLFSLHPLAVESVSEVSYSSSLLVTAFTLLALWLGSFFQPQDRGRRVPVGVLAAGCCLAAVMCKESGIAAAVLLGCYWWLYRRQEAKHPWLLFLTGAGLSCVFFLIARFVLAPPGGGEIPYIGGSFERVFVIQPRLWAFMMGKIVCPLGLSADYTPVDQLGLSTPVSIALLVAVVGLQIWLACRSRLAALGVSTYWVGLATVSNFMPLFRPLADRFYYLPLCGVAMELVAILVLLMKWPRSFWLGTSLLAAFTVWFGCLSIQREAVFANNLSLWTDTLKVNPRSAVAEAGLGWELYQKGDLNGAIVRYQKALELNSRIPEAYNNLGLAYYQLGRWDDALLNYQRAETLDSSTSQIPNNIGLVLEQKGKPDEAILEFQKALAINPHFVEAHNNYGMALADEGRFGEAAAQYREVLQSEPDLAETHNNLGIVLAKMGQVQEAATEFQEALRLKPEYETARTNLAKLQSLPAR